MRDRDLTGADITIAPDGKRSCEAELMQSLWDESDRRRFAAQRSTFRSTESGPSGVGGRGLPGRNKQGRRPELKRRAARTPFDARAAYSPALVIVSHRDPLEKHPTTPERSLDQRMAALEIANETRALRAQLKRDLKAGRASIGELLLDPPAFVYTAKVFDMLLALPKVGRVKATKIMNNCRVSPNKTFGGLSDRQRAELAERLNQWPPTDDRP